MKTKRERLHGVVVPAITPVDKNDKADATAFRAVLNRLIEAGVNGIFVGGPAYERLKAHLGIHGRPPAWISPLFGYALMDEDVLRMLGSDGRPVMPGPVPASVARELAPDRIIDAWGVTSPFGTVAGNARMNPWRAVVRTCRLHAASCHRLQWHPAVNGAHASPARNCNVHEVARDLRARAQQAGACVAPPSPAGRGPTG